MSERRKNYSLHLFNLHMNVYARRMTHKRKSAAVISLDDINGLILNFFDNGKLCCFEEIKKNNFD